MIEDNCGYVYEHLVPSEGAVSVEVVHGGVSKDIRTVVKHITGDGKVTREKEPHRSGLSMTNRAVCMREMRKDLGHRRRKRERRKERRKFEYKREKEQKLRKIPGRSILSSYVWRKTSELLQKCIKFAKM